MEHLQCWWDKLTTEGTRFGYFVNPSKTWLVIKDRYYEEASRSFAGSGINISTKGRPYLGAAIGSQEFVEEYVNAKVQSWSSSITLLSETAKSQPHAAFSAVTHGLLSKWTYLSRVTPNIGHLLAPLDTVLRNVLLPGIMGRPPPNDLECDLFALPAWHRELGIKIASKNANRELQSSLLITSPPTKHITADQMENKAIISRPNKKRSSMQEDELHFQLPSQLQRAVNLAKEKAASSWLTDLPLKEQGSSLHKSSFHNVLALRYG